MRQQLLYFFFIKMQLGKHSLTIKNAKNTDWGGGKDDWGPSITKVSSQEDILIRKNNATATQLNYGKIKI